ncbi:TY-Chap domain-containing protein [Methylobacterium sp. J-076]|uniref:TY-Chap domain-containing protein n=1 Tax=Methylobacterium sp. J-076 TaxID=2836655 RepID=UPI001FBB0671|nr:hypothetical protein [Methylobacterium sp. J-076]MCJ2013695.1 hypothetical protein [Methylobacterium sp. J-076]
MTATSAHRRRIARAVRRRGLWRLVPASAALIGAGMQPAAADAMQHAAFMAKYRCPVVAVLTEIHLRGPVGRSWNRFLSLSLRGVAQSYVQCMFIERDTAMYCEASSGAYGPATDQPFHLVPPEEARAALHRLGYRQNDPSRNYERILPLGTPPNVGLAADLMLAALFHAYGARDWSTLEVEAPRGGDAALSCGAPVS